MEIRSLVFRLLTASVFSVCLVSIVISSSENTEISPEEKQQRQKQAFDKAAAAPRDFRAELKEHCPHFNTVLLDTAETIQLGTRIFNAGGAGLTVRVYEGTIYKILFVIDEDCMELSDALQAGLIMAEQKESFEDKAWALRETLDLIMGGPPLEHPGS